jgi:hypothetical protein
MGYLRYDHESDSLSVSFINGAYWIPLNDSLVYTVNPSKYDFKEFEVNSDGAVSSVRNHLIEGEQKNAKVYLKRCCLPEFYSKKIDSLSVNHDFDSFDKFRFSSSEFIPEDAWNKN